MATTDTTTIPALPAGTAGRSSSKGALIAAAIDEFSERGYEDATVAGIAERAGVTTGALYAHFHSKLGLLIEAVGLQSVDDFSESLMAAASLPSGNLPAVLRRPLVRRPDPRTLLLLDAIVTARRDPAVAATLRRGLQLYVDAMAAATDDAEAAGLVDPSLDAADVARTISALSLGLMVLAALGEEPPSPLAIVQTTDALMRPTAVDGDDQPAALARVRARADATTTARARLEDAIVQAAADGHSLRRIGDAAGLSHEGVRRILRERL